MILNVSDGTPSTGKTVEDRRNVAAKILKTMMFFSNNISDVCTLYGYSSVEALEKRTPTKKEMSSFLKSYEKYDDSGEDPIHISITTYSSGDFLAVGDMYSTLVLKGAVQPSSKSLTRAWTPIVNELCSEEAAKKIAKDFGFDLAIVPERRLRVLKKEIIGHDPTATVTFGCCGDPTYDIFGEDYDTLMSSNGDIMLVFDDYMIIMS